MNLIRQVTTDGVLVLGLSGRIDNAAGTALWAAAEPELRDGARIVLDATAVTDVTDAGVRLLNTVVHQAQRRGGTAVLAGLAPAVRDSLAASGWLSRLRAEPEVVSAVRAVAGGVPA